jgi:hypothetical protein
MLVFMSVCLLSSLIYAAFFRKIPGLRLVFSLKLTEFSWFADGYRRTPVGFLFNLILFYIPTILDRLDRYFTNGRAAWLVSQVIQYVTFEKRPALLASQLPIVL